MVFPSKSSPSSSFKKFKDLFVNELFVIAFWLSTLLTFLSSVGTDLFGVDRSGVSTLISLGINGIFIGVSALTAWRGFSCLTESKLELTAVSLSAVVSEVIEGKTGDDKSSVFAESSTTFVEKRFLKDGGKWEGLSSSASAILGSVSIDDSSGNAGTETVISLWLNGSGSSASGTSNPYFNIDL